MRARSMTVLSRIIAPLTAPRRADGDPLVWCVAITLGFLVLVLHRLGTPSKIMFDEVHYLPAARRLIALSSRLNPEHPLLGKEFIALGMMLFGDGPFGWRLPNALLGTLGLYAAMRTMWWASLSRSATLMFGLLFATNFIWFVLSRIAMLDMAMASMMALAFWQAALAFRKGSEGGQGSRLHLALCGVLLGLSLGGKWNGAPILALPGLLFAWDRWWALAGRRRGLLVARDAGPIPGVSLLEAVAVARRGAAHRLLRDLCAGLLLQGPPLTLEGLIPWQGYMLKLQDSVVKPHVYQSRWWQWVFNIRPIWFFYAPWDGAQRGVLMIGNPFTMLAGLPALLLCLWSGVRKGRSAARGSGGALCRQPDFLGDQRQAGAVLLPLCAGERVPDGGAGAGAGRLVATGAALAGGTDGGHFSDAVHRVLPDPLRRGAGGEDLLPGLYLARQLAVRLLASLSLHLQQGCARQ